MVEDYAIKIRVGQAEQTGRYEITRIGTRRAITRFVERYETPAGRFLPEEWKKRAMAAIEAEGEIALLEKIKEHCRNHCAWLKKELEIEEYAMDCLCSRAYLHWADFQGNTTGDKMTPVEDVIWM